MKKEIKRIENLLKDNNLWSSYKEDVEKYKELERQHAELLKTDEIIWRQRSRAMWLKEGDKSTKFFHGKASQRRQTNGIKKLKDVDGVWWHGEENIERVLINYFAELFSTSYPTDIERTCEVVRGKLSEEHKTWCARTFTEEDIVEAINQMHPLKSPGPNGLPALFFQKYWHIVGEDVNHLVLEILNNGKAPDEINKTSIVLIPKAKNPASPKDFRVQCGDEDGD